VYRPYHAVDISLGHMRRSTMIIQKKLEFQTPVRSEEV
jgi:hypothetical protein